VVAAPGGAAARSVGSHARDCRADRAQQLRQGGPQLLVGRPISDPGRLRVMDALGTPLAGQTRVGVGALVLAAACRSCLFAWCTTYVRGIRLGLGGGDHLGRFESGAEVLGRAVVVESVEVASLGLNRDYPLSFIR